MSLDQLKVIAVNLKAWSASTAGFSVSLYRDNEWANVYHSINDCSVDERREDAPCRTLER